MSPGVFAAGDAARYPDPRTGAPVRIEHWVVAERQGQAAARNMIGRREPFRAVPFFWSQHYDAVLNYVGHAERWDATELDGSLASREFKLTYKSDGAVRAVLTMSRDKDSLAAEAAMEACNRLDEPLRLRDSPAQPSGRVRHRMRREEQSTVFGRRGAESHSGGGTRVLTP